MMREGSVRISWCDGTSTNLVREIKKESAEEVKTSGKNKILKNAFHNAVIIKATPKFITLKYIKLFVGNCYELICVPHRL
jgi:hypothetical protein